MSERDTLAELLDGPGRSLDAEKVTSKLAARDCPPCGPCCAEHPHWSHWHAPVDVAPSPDAPGPDVVERRRLAGRLAAWALSPGESFRTLLPYLDLDYETAYREGWMAFTNGIAERMTSAAQSEETPE